MDERSRLDRFLFGEYQRRPILVAEKLFRAIYLSPAVVVVALTIGPFYPVTSAIAGIISGALAILVLVRSFNDFVMERHERRPPDAP
jgi:hypothetical protein